MVLNSGPQLQLRPQGQGILTLRNRNCGPHQPHFPAIVTAIATAI